MIINHSLDYLTIGLYLGGVFTLAFYSSKQKKRKKSPLAQEQYLANRSLSVPESLFSIMATEISALTFLGLPAFAYSKDFSFIHIYFGAAIGRIFIAQLMLPLVYNKGLTIYSVMGNTGTPKGQMAISIFYALNKFLAVGVRLFSGSILISEFFNTSIYLAILIISTLTFVYTLIGGLKAVVRTDMAQMLLLTTGGVVAHYLIPSIANTSWSELMSMAIDANKINIFDSARPSVFIIGFFGGILFDMATHGADQDFAQRLTANRSLKGAQLAILSSGILSILMGLLFLGIGALLWSYFQVTTPVDIPNDKIFAYFITQYFPPGLKGLMIAGVLAATMSTLDSSINAISSCFYNDIFYERKKNSQKIKTYYFRDTLIITTIFILISFWASMAQGLLVLGLKITSWTAGPLLAVFFATLVFKSSRLTWQNVLGTYFTGIIGVYINQEILAWSWYFNVYFGFLFGLSFLFIKKRLKRSRGNLVI